MNLNNLKGKKAIVTGAGQGLSKGMAEGLMEAGAEVVIMDLNKKAIEVAKNYVNKGFKCHSVIADVSDDRSREAAFLEALNKLNNHLDILVNGAGVQRRSTSEDFSLKDWDFVININLKSVFALCQLAGRQYIKQGSKGKIINISSMLAFFGGYTVPAYAASKGGVSQLTKALCNEWASKGINVNALAPGYMATDMNTALLKPDNPRNKAITDRIPTRAWGTPEDMKGPVVWLASDASNYINGAIIPVDGGYLVR